MRSHNRTLTPRILLLVAILLFAAQAGATNLIQNGSFQSNDFTDWTIGTTSNGTWGSGYPVVTGWPLGGMNAAQGEVGEVTFDGTQQGGTLTQTFNSAGGAATESLLWAAMANQQNADGGEFTMILNNVQIAQFDTGTINAGQTLNGMLSASTPLLAGTNTLEIVVSRRFITLANGGTPFQWVTGVDVEGAVPEPSSILLLGIGALGLAGVLRRKLGF